MRIHVAFGVVVLMAAAVPVAAQQTIEIPVSDTTKGQVTAFEGTLRGAIDSAAANLNKRVRDAMPDRGTMLAFERDTLVTGVWMPEGGAVFHVLIPKIREIDLRLFILAQRSIAPRPSNSGRVNSAGMVEADPPVAPAPKGPPLTDPDGEYTQFTRTALLDALLDGALALPIPEGKHLTVIADELLSDPPSPFNPRSRTLVLQISGEDLLALRQNKINRDEAKGRIRQYRY